MTLSQAEIIKRATLSARKDFVGFSKHQEAEIIKMYEEAGRTLAAQAIPDGMTADTFQLSQTLKGRKKNLLAQIDAEIAKLRISLNAKIMASMRKSIDGGMAGMTGVANAAGISGNITIGSSFIGKDGKVRRYDPKTTTLAASRWGQINKSAMDHLVRYRPGGLTFSQNVWSANWEVQRTMRNMVNQSVLIGESSQKLARKLMKYTTKQGLQTRPGVYKSAYKNAWRMARTEINRAFHEGQIRYSQEKDHIIDGHIWRLGGGGPWNCVCPDLAGRFFPTDNTPAKPHPNCMCYLEFHIIGDDKPEDQGPLEPRTQKAIDVAV